MNRVATTVDPAIFCADRRKTGEAEDVCWETIGPSDRQALGRVLIVPGLTSPYRPKYLALYRDVGSFIAAEGWQAAVFSGRGQLGSREFDALIWPHLMV